MAASVVGGSDIDRLENRADLETPARRSPHAPFHLPTTSHPKRATSGTRRSASSTSYEAGIKSTFPAGYCAGDVAGDVELVRQANEAFNRRDMDALLAFMDTDVEFVSRLVPMEGSYHGHDGIRRWWDDLLDTLPDFAIEVVDVHDPGDLTVATVRTRGHGAGSDIPLDETVWQVARWRSGKCVWWRNFHTRAEVLEAVGPSE